MPEDKDTALKRIARGFRVMYDKFANSNYVKNIREENSGSLLPPELNQEKDTEKIEEKPEPKKKVNYKPEKDFYATDFSDLGVDF